MAPWSACSASEASVKRLKALYQVATRGGGADCGNDAAQTAFAWWLSFLKASKWTFFNIWQPLWCVRRT